MNVVVGTDISEIPRLHDSVSQFCRENGLSAEIEGDVCLALEEIVINVIRYGYPEGGKHDILVGLSLDHDCVTAAVEDDGAPFNPLGVPEPDTHSLLEARPIGGLGIQIVRHLMDRLEYSRIDDRNRLVMRKRVPRSE
jgi:serine/threonine-protein kinase RsbW